KTDVPTHARERVGADPAANTDDTDGRSQQSAGQTESSDGPDGSSVTASDVPNEEPNEEPTEGATETPTGRTEEDSSTGQDQSSNDQTGSTA
ncbi:hypothetical protein G3I15_12050, partial [Streptomyces sp. SID10244]|nr:hypothetical protein [Streptomyces sp. SID10244]